jgi:SAM-dependent methyltransferase
LSIHERPAFQLHNDTILQVEMKTDNTIFDFYDALAPDYDSMTNFEKRFVSERPLFLSLVKRYGIETALDAGSGTGFHSLLLAQLGVSVTAVDISTEMLRMLDKHAAKMNLRIKTIRSDFDKLGNKAHGKYFDAVFCLGNSIPHLLTSEQLQSALMNFSQLLKPGGVLFVQLLNYDRILEQRERIQNVKEFGNTTFVRFYDFEEELVRFNILKLERKDSAITTTLTTVPLRPIRKNEIIGLLEKLGYVNIACYGTMSLNEFLPSYSTDLVIVADSPTANRIRK